MVSEDTRDGELNYFMRGSSSYFYQQIDPYPFGASKVTRQIFVLGCHRAESRPTYDCDTKVYLIITDYTFLLPEKHAHHEIAK